MSKYEKDINRFHLNEIKRERTLTQGLIVWAVIYAGVGWFFEMDWKLMFIIGIPSFLIIFWLIKIYMGISLFNGEVSIVNENMPKDE